MIKDVATTLMVAKPRTTRFVIEKYYKSNVEELSVTREIILKKKCTAESEIERCCNNNYLSNNLEKHQDH